MISKPVRRIFSGIIWFPLPAAATARNGVASGIATFRFDDRNQNIKGFTTGVSGFFGKTKNRPHISFTKLAMPPNAALAANEFNAWYIAMADVSAGVGTTHFTLPGNGGPDIMLTSQLSGCTFGVGSDTGGGSRLVSHIQPDNGQNARQTLHNTMVGGLNNNVDGLFERENQPGKKSYESVKNRATVMGLRVGTAWQFWAQTYKAGTNREIYSVTRIV